MRGIVNGYSRLLLVAFCVVTALALLSAGATTAAPFGAYNPGWDGGAGLRATADSVGADSVIVRNATRIADYPANETVVVVIAPESTYSDDGAKRLSNFVRAGGTLLVTDDVSGPINTLLDALGARARVDGRLIRDERYNYRSPALPVATNVSDHPLTTDVSKLTLNYGTPVQPNGATVLVSTSEYAYIDENRNGNLDETETLRSRPVATVERVGSGRVIVVGDPSVFINAMLERPGNRRFAGNVFAPFEHVVFDHSQTTQLPPMVVALLVIRSSELLQLCIGGLGLTLIALWSTRPSIIYRLRHRLSGTDAPDDGETADFDIKETIERAYPDWDHERIQRVTQEVKTNREKGDANDRPR